MIPKYFANKLIGLVFQSPASGIEVAVAPGSPDIYDFLVLEFDISDPIVPESEILELGVVVPEHPSFIPDSDCNPS